MNGPKPRKSKSRAPQRIKKIAEYLGYVIFTATPRAMRETKYGCINDIDYAKINKLDLTTLSHWRARDGFWDEVKAQLIKWGKDKTPDIMAALYRTAQREGKAPEVKLWNQLIEGWMEKIDSNLTLNKESIKALQESNKAIFEMAKKKHVRRK